MIHVATIHFRSETWVELQLRYLRRHSAEPIRLWASLDGLGADHSGDFDRPLSLGEAMEPAEKLDRLGEMMLAEAEPADLIAFLHGDCFPISEWTAPVRAALQEHPLVAVRRHENFGEPFPHPSFAVTTARFWRELGSSWAAGPSYVEPDGRTVTDVGAKLWRDLDAAGIEWQALERTNAVDLHPLWFGVYGGLVYHHGAGFRHPISRADAHRSRGWPMPLRRAHWAWRVLRNKIVSRRVMRSLQGDGELLSRLAGFEAARSKTAST